MLTTQDSSMFMNDNVRAQLVDIVRQDGINIVDNTQRLRELLTDKCPEARREINVLMAALAVKIPDSLRRVPPGMPFVGELSSYTQRLVDATALSAEAARWAVETWAIVLGVLPPQAAAPVRLAIVSSNAPVLARRQWVVAAKAPDSFLQWLTVHPLVGQLLYNRGLRTVSDVHTFLSSSGWASSDPYKLVDMAPAVQRTLQAIRSGEKICVYGNSDVDGVSATALLVTALQVAGANVHVCVPDRLDESCGLDVDAITRSVKARLLITVGCGSRSLK